MESDTTKWPEHFAELQKIDAVLKCGICYDYMKTSMLTNCSHSYCSLCIRKFLQYSNKCPTCFIEAHEADLRNNRLLDDIILFFVQIKSKLLKAIRVAEVVSKGTSNVADNVCTPTASVASPKTGIQAFMTPPSSKAPKSIRGCLFPTKPSVISEAVPVMTETSCVVPRMFTVSKPSPTATSKVTAPVEKSICPVCEVEIPSRNINMHLDACLQRSTATTPKLQPVKKRKRSPLPKRLYHLMSDKDLKKVLKEYKLNAQGERRVLLNRIRRYTVLYNAETDEDNPRPVVDIVLQVEREEREENKKENKFFKALSQKVDRYSNPDEIDKANKQYINDNKDNFKKLIESMKIREEKSIKPLKPSRLLESDEEGLSLVGGSGWDPSKPSTSGEVADDVYLDETVCLSDEEGSVKVADGETLSPKKTPTQESLVSTQESLERSSLENHDSSQDSIFELSTTKSVLRTSTPGKKKFVKIKNMKKRSPSPEFFPDNSPDKDLYESIFEDSEVAAESLDNAQESERSSLEKDERLHGNGEELNENHLTEDDKPKKRKRKKANELAPTNNDDSLAVRRPRRTSKKLKSNSPS